MRIAAAFVSLLFFACATTDKPLAAPEWETIPLGVVDAFCQRLQAEGLGVGGTMAIISTTQPIATMNALAAVGGPSPRRVTGERAAAALRGGQKSIPITLGGNCAWTAVDPQGADRWRDLMLVELSAPVANPFAPGQAGLFARVTLNAQNASWYWITLAPRPGGWAVGYIQALAV